MRPSAKRTVYKDDGEPQAAARRRIEVAHGNRAHERTDPDAAGTNDRNAGELLPPAGPGLVLPALGEGGVLRDDVRVAVPLPVPIEAEAMPAPIGPEYGETEAAWREFHDRLRAFVSRRVRDAADAEDIVQRVFLQMHRTLPTVRNTDRLGGWLYQAARNAIADHYRAPSRRREIPSGDTRPLDGRDSGEVDGEPDAAEVACAADCLRSLIGQLPETYRQAIERVEIQGLSQKAAAGAAGLSVSGMKTRVQRGRQRLQAMLLEQCRLAVDSRGGILACEARSAAGRPCRTRS